MTRKSEGAAAGRLGALRCRECIRRVGVRFMGSVSKHEVAFFNGLSHAAEMDQLSPDNEPVHACTAMSALAGYTFDRQRLGLYP